MDFEFADEGLRRLYTEATFSAGHSQAVVKGFRKVMQVIAAAVDERDLYAMRSLNFEKLKGKREGQWSLRINRQWRVIVQLVGSGGGGKKVLVLEITDYH